MDANTQAQVQQLLQMEQQGTLPAEYRAVLQQLRQSGIIPPQGGAQGPQGAPAPDPRQVYANALRNYTPPGVEFGSQGQPYLASHDYGATQSRGAGVPREPLNPQQMMQYNLAQNMGQTQAQASGGRPIEQAADTETRPWARQTEAGYLQRAKQAAAQGEDPSQFNPANAPLQAVPRVKGAPITYPSDPDINAAIQMLRQQMMQGQ